MAGTIYDANELRSEGCVIFFLRGKIDADNAMDRLVFFHAIKLQLSGLKF